jgi:hypothetical protein
MKMASKERCHSSAPTAPFLFKEAARRNLWEKVTLTLFWDHQGPPVEHYGPRDTQSPVLHTTSESSHHISTDILLLNDIARPHTRTASLTPEMVSGIHQSVLSIFRPLKKTLGGNMKKYKGGA